MCTNITGLTSYVVTPSTNPATAMATETTIASQITTNPGTSMAAATTTAEIAKVPATTTTAATTTVPANNMTYANTEEVPVGKCHIIDTITSM